MKTFKTIFLSVSLFVSLVFTSCSKDDNPTPQQVIEEEVITTVTTVLRKGTQTITLTSRDVDGDGPTQPVVTVSGNLSANTIYTGTITILNETVTPAEDITEEILTKGLEHQFFFQAPTTLGSFAYTDADSAGKPIGLAFSYTTLNAATGNFTLVLRHEPNKSASGVATGNIANAGGSTDAEVIYPIVVQ